MWLHSWTHPRRKYEEQPRQKGPTVEKEDSHGDFLAVIESDLLLLCFCTNEGEFTLIGGAAGKKLLSGLTYNWSESKLNGIYTEQSKTIPSVSLCT